MRKLLVALVVLALVALATTVIAADRDIGLSPITIDVYVVGQVMKGVTTTPTTMVVDTVAELKSEAAPRELVASSDNDVYFDKSVAQIVAVQATTPGVQLMMEAQIPAPIVAKVASLEVATSTSNRGADFAQAAFFRRGDRQLTADAGWNYRTFA